MLSDAEEHLCTSLTSTQLSSEKVISIFSRHLRHMNEWELQTEPFILSLN